MILGSRIKMLRTSFNMTMEEFAKKLDMSHGVIGLYEKNQRTPSVEVLMKMCEVFDVSMNFFFQDKKKNEDELYVHVIHEAKNKKISASKLLELINILSNNDE